MLLQLRSALTAGQAANHEHEGAPSISSPTKRPRLALGTSNSLVGPCSTQTSTLDILQHVDGASTLRDTPALSAGLETNYM
jgi:hypothetical protein